MTYTEFEAEILNLTGIDLTLYKEKQMKRRLDTLISRMGLDGYDSYLELLRRDKMSPHHHVHHHPWHRTTSMTEDMGTLRYFLQYITITVTKFFRTQDQWNAMADIVLPALPDDAVIWCCACATGEEPYSMAMSIALRRSLANIRIIATDIDDDALRIAQRGEYTMRTMSNIYNDTLKKFFTKTEKGYRVNDDIRSHVEFRHLNILADPLPQGCDLIVCRNVLIYFTDEAKDKLFHEFHDCLVPGGYLFTGKAEQLLKYKVFNFSKIKNYIYQKEEK